MSNNEINNVLHGQKIFSLDFTRENLFSVKINQKWRSQAISSIKLRRIISHNVKDEKLKTQQLVGPFIRGKIRRELSV